MSYDVNWEAVRDFVYRLPARPNTTIIAGSPEWRALDDQDPQKLAAVITAGSRWCLEEEIEQRRRRREAQKDMSMGLLEELPWKKIRQQMADRDAFYKKNPDLRRRRAS
ncbi:DUF2742 domain-containing protein [Gordonia alkanivorans]|uniref:DUF2742 domain-containing protein n=1 Tax=Gordonia alkanivorans TaxID=84096 RepID=UPI00244842B2|nr:DUF2742 domain-containing protein [Gordonia alkanivorans]MDH3007089.1 DUF2742 domain-containing protein [Gordonia alkanivorans]MDH3015037.1 DUF2742 domain-containing protein [Gordonia alkanivorans]MDH3021624.1 DUF2742 domain-containing protein [Gordonia alkanivorans]MDH3040153.1 DUF2742 domain-containing protein [Gordonia alkanivorans]MDH3059411.1 DUF2742 domain-containing protein [Gordonia alkanivorans]